MSALDDLPVLVLDCQATGASPAHGHLLEVGWCVTRARAEPPAVEQVHASLVLLPEGESIPAPVQRVTGLGDDDLGDGRPGEEVWAQVLREAERGGVGAAAIHYARFEESFLRPLHRRMRDGASLPWPITCTHAIARRLWPDLPRCGLRALAGYLGHSASELRRSAGHVAATALVWRRIVERVADEGIDSLEALQGWLAQPAAPRSGVRVYPMPRDKRLSLPRSPGVYRMRRSNGDVLYVGKATSLRDRVNTYFQKQSRIPERTLEMLSQARDIDVSPTDTPLEAALLECDEIKRTSAPYNVALRQRGRSTWFAADGFASLAPHASARHRIGPLGSAWWPGRYAALMLALRAPEFDRAAVVAAVAYGASEAEDEPLREGLATFRAHLPEGGMADDRAMMRVGADAWAYRLAEAEVVPDCDDAEPEADDEAEPVWDASRVAQTLEDLVVMVAHAVRRARWLCRLSEASVAWSEPRGGAVRHTLVLEHGVVVDRARVAPGQLPPVPPGHARGARARRRDFDLATYDRLRVLTTELRRVVAGGRSVAVRFGPCPPIAGPRLRRTLAWV